MESKKERAHREALAACEERAEVVGKAIAKLIAYIEDHPENPAFVNRSLRRFETLLPITVRETE